MTTWKKDILARPVSVIQKENLGVMAFFSEIIELTFGKNALYSFYFKTSLELFFLNYL